MAIPKLEKEFEYKGFPCVVLFMPTGYRCGYVGIPKEAKLDTDNIACHGGITYKNNHLYYQNQQDLLWIGFDCAHCFDAYDVETAKRLFADDENVMLQITTLESTGFYALSNDGGTVRTLKYCEEECCRIVDQVIERTGANDCN